MLRLTNVTTPFTSALNSRSDIHLYFGLGVVPLPGDAFRGGFFTDRHPDFAASVQNASYHVFTADPAGTVLINGLPYAPYVAGSVAISSVPQSADFGAGPVNGYILELTVVPEPSTAVLLAAGALCLLHKRRSA